MNYIKRVMGSALCFLVFIAAPSFASDYELTPFIGQMFSSELIGAESGENISASNDMHVGLALAWQDTPNGQGQILINAVSHDFANEASGLNQSLDIYYAHFSGVAQFRQQNYVTTVSLGLGGAYFDANGGEELYPSLTAAFGTRYEIDTNLSLVTELRAYASLTDDKNGVFCQAEACSAQFDGAVWVDTAISVGVAYKF
ncbi:hypothetical protein AAD001_02960 [Colwelliaceae bacterium 6471]